MVIYIRHTRVKQPFVDSDKGIDWDIIGLPKKINLALARAKVGIYFSIWSFANSHISSRWRRRHNQALLTYRTTSDLLVAEFLIRICHISV